MCLFSALFYSSPIALKPTADDPIYSYIFNEDFAGLWENEKIKWRFNYNSNLNSENSSFFDSLKNLLE